MNFKEILIFDISSEYGHFRKYNTTTSPLTYSIPTRTAIAGILGAILGMERETADRQFPEGVDPVQEFFSKKSADIAVQILHPVKKEYVAFNLINTKKSFYDLTKAGRTQIKFELLKNPKFRVFFAMDYNPVTLNHLAERIKLKRHHFSPYLGLAQYTATVEFVSLTRGENKENLERKFVEIITAINLSKITDEKPVEFDNTAAYSANNMPMEMDRYREVKEYSEILIEKNGNPIRAKASNYFSVEPFGNIMFL